MSENETLAGRLKASRLRLGLSQAEVALRAGMKQTSYSELERGRSKRTGHLAELASALNVDLRWLATGINEDTDEDQLFEEIRTMTADQKSKMLALIRAMKQQ